MDLICPYGPSSHRVDAGLNPRSLGMTRTCGHIHRHTSRHVTGHGMLRGKLVGWMRNWKVVTWAKCVLLSCGSGLYGCIVFDIDDEEGQQTAGFDGSLLGFFCEGDWVAP